MNPNNNYIGNELELFKNATNWKTYFSRKITDFITGDVLEVGAGIGINTPYLVSNNNRVKSITTIEPDASLCKQISENHQKQHISAREIINGTINDTKNKYDTIIYIDVLEHIELSMDEIEHIKKRLKPSGHLIILVPAFQFLFSEFDKRIGHYRRYNKKRLREDVNHKLTEKKIFYLDSLGFIASLTNKLILKKDTPTIKNIQFWDKTLIPISTLVDQLSFNCIGKSLVGIYQNNETE